MTLNYQNYFPDLLFGREVTKNVSGYPSEELTSMFDPRGTNANTLNCQSAITGADPDKTADSPDDFLVPGEMKPATTLAEQVLIEMSRGRFWTDGSYLDESAISALPPPSESDMFTGAFAKFNDADIFAIDGDSRDGNTDCTFTDKGNNVNTETVGSGDGSLLIGKGDTSYLPRQISTLEPHIAKQLNGSSRDNDASQKIYASPGGDQIILTPGKSYTLIVASAGGGVGNYELRFRKVSKATLNVGATILSGNNVVCKQDF
jgi:hypothetical protein